MSAHLDRENDEEQDGREGDPHLYTVNHQNEAHDQLLGPKNCQVVPSLMNAPRLRGMNALYVNYIRALASSGCAGAAACEPLPLGSSQKR